MGRLHLILDDDIEKKFRQSFDGLKKGDISKKIQELITKELGQEIKETKKDMKIIGTFARDIDKLILKFYNSEEFSILAANKVALEWDKLKEKYKIK